MQRARWASLTSRSGGSSAVHWSIRQVQRGAKKQPLGRLPGDGARPGMPDSCRLPEMWGMAPISRRV